MASNVTNLWDQQLVEASAVSPPIVAGEMVDLLVSGEIPNTAYDSVQVTLKYEDILPNVAGSGTYSIAALTEFKDDNGIWRFLPASQFSPIRKASAPPNRILIMQPDMNMAFNIGTDDVIFLGRELARISRTQGILPDKPMRVRIAMVENDPGGPSAFVSMKVSGEVEQYSV